MNWSRHGTHAAPLVCDSVRVMAAFNWQHLDPGRIFKDKQKINESGRWGEGERPRPKCETGGELRKSYRLKGSLGS